MDRSRPPISENDRTCTVCGLTRKPREQLAAAQASILAISPLLYWRGDRKRVLKSCPAVRACEDCLAKAIIQPLGEEAGIIAQALLSSIGTRYSAILEGK